MKSWNESNITAPQLESHLDGCLGCLACQTACPSGVQYGELLFASRAALTESNHHNAGTKFSNWLRRQILIHILPHRNRLNTGRWLLQQIQKLGLIEAIANSPLPKLIKPLDWYTNLIPDMTGPYKRLTPGMSFGNPYDPVVALLTGCVMDTIYNPIHWDTINALVSNNFYVTIPEQTCCGALAEHAGESDLAQWLATQNIRSLMRNNPQYIVMNSAGCGAMMKHYSEAFPDNHPMKHDAHDLEQRVVDVMELLAKKQSEGTLAPFIQPLNVTVTYHAACHLAHAQKITKEPIEVLGDIPGITLIPLTDADTCCGSAGIYNVEHPELSAAILDPKLQAIADTKANIVVTGNPGCLMQLQAGIRQTALPIQAHHPITLVAAAYGHKSLVLN